MTILLDQKWAVFLKVAEVESLTRASVALKLPQPTISRLISALETDCGERLFQRTGRGVKLTDFGSQLLPEVRGFSNEASRIEDFIRTKGKTPSGEVRLGLLPSAVGQVAGALLKTARERFPRIRLHLSDGSSAQLAEQLRDGRLDFALLLHEGASGDSSDQTLSETYLHLVGLAGDTRLAAATMPLSKLQGLPLIVPSRPHPLRIRLDALAEAMALKLDFAVTADSTNLQHEIAAAGGGYAISSAVFDVRHHKILKAIQIVEPSLVRHLVLATTPRRPNSLATREISRLILEIVPALLKV